MSRISDVGWWLSYSNVLAMLCGIEIDTVVWYSNILWPMQQFGKCCIVASWLSQSPYTYTYSLWCTTVNEPLFIVAITCRYLSAIIVRVFHRKTSYLFDLILNFQLISSSVQWDNINACLSTVHKHKLIDFIIKWLHINMSYSIGMSGSCMYRYGFRKWSSTWNKNRFC